MLNFDSFNAAGGGGVLIRHNLPSVDGSFIRIKTVPALNELQFP